MATIFETFNLKGIQYYKHQGDYYADNYTTRSIITLKAFKDAMMNKLIQG